MHAAQVKALPLIRAFVFFRIFSSENIPLRGKIVSHGTFIASININ